MKNPSLKIGIILTVSILALTACGQKGALYLPKDTTSEIPNASTDTPNDLPNNQNPNITQDKKNDY